MSTIVETDKCTLKRRWRRISTLRVSQRELLDIPRSLSALIPGEDFQKEAMTSGSREGLLAEDDRNPEQIADLLLSQISHFKTFLCISSESPNLLCFKIWVKLWFNYLLQRWIWLFPAGWYGKGSACKAGDLGLIPGPRRFPGEGNSYPLQHSYLENPMDRGAGWAKVHRSQGLDMTEQLILWLSTVNSSALQGKEWLDIQVMHLTGSRVWEWRTQYLVHHAKLLLFAWASSSTSLCLIILNCEMGMTTIPSTSEGCYEQ